VSQERATEPWLRLRFLGGCEVSLPEGAAHLETAKTRALLIYLSSSPGPQSRHTLMGLLWGDLPEAKARRNLRRALWNLRQQLAVPRLPPLLVSDRQTVRFNREFPYWSDVETFEAACSELEAASPSSLSASHLTALGRAIDLYSGEFLQGFYVDNAPAFEEWVLGEREQLRARALQALERLVEGYAARDEVEAALDCARRLLALEPWREETHRWLMRLLARSGQRTAALAQYETCRRILAQDLGVEPAPATVALAKRIRAGTISAPASNLPAATTPFVGRSKELTEIASLLGRADCRLLTVTGLGGVGKTRLALEAATRQAPSFADGAYYVELGALHSPDRIPAAVAQALGVSLLGAREPRAALLDYLRERQILVVLDGFEHLLAGAPLLGQMLQIAPGIKIVVTSRERLNLYGEWVYVLEGLACPADERTADLASCDAIQLFLQTARRVHLGFRVAEEEQVHLVRICRLVAGLPLAIEMAAAWVRLLPLAEIAQEIARRLDLLVTPLRDLPEHHRSMRAVFERSWQFLSPEEQRVLARLAVFRGTMRPAEAQQVTRASLTTLSALVDKSLLQRLPSGRYRLHELVRQYAGERLAEMPDEVERARERHCQTYAAPLARYEQALTEGNPVPVLDWVAHERENVRAAWGWAASRQDVKTLEAMQSALADAHHLTGDFLEGESLFREALERLGGLEGEGTLGLLPWKLLSARAAFAVYLGRFDQAQADLERCLDVFARHGVRKEMAQCRFFLGEIARFRGEHDPARRFYEQSLTDYRQEGDLSAAGFCLNGLGLVASALGDMSQARAYLGQSLRTFRGIGHEMGQAIAGANLADLLIRLDDPAGARKALAQSAALFQKLGHRWGQATCLRHQGDLARQVGRNAEARAYYEQSLRLLQEIGQRQAASGCLIRLAEVCADLGEEREAVRYLGQALVLTDELGEQAETVGVAATLAALLGRLGERARARQLASQVARHPAAPPAARAQVERLLTELGRTADDQAAQMGEGHSLEEMVAESMAVLDALVP